MTTNTAPTITSLQAQGAASTFLSDHLPDRFTAGHPVFDPQSNVWRVPVLLTYAVIGVVGQVGEVIVSADSEEIISSTPVKDMKAAAQALYEKHRDEIEAPVP
jgi:hypothetical protein